MTFCVDVYKDRGHAETSQVLHIALSVDAEIFLKNVGGMEDRGLRKGSRVHMVRLRPFLGKAGGMFQVYKILQREHLSQKGYRKDV